MPIGDNLLGMVEKAYGSVVYHDTKSISYSDKVELIGTELQSEYVMF